MERKTAKTNKKANSPKSIRAEALEFLEVAKQKSGLSFSAISARAGISPSTITRFIKDDSMQELSLSSLNKIAEACGFGSYKNYLEQSTAPQKIEISDVVKFETYDAVRRILTSRNKNFRQADATNITNNVIEHAKMLGTDFITDSLITYVIERFEQ